MRKLLLAAIAALLLPTATAEAQSVNYGNVVTSCGTPNSTYTANTNRAATVDVNGNQCTSASGGGSSTANQGTPNAGGAQSWHVDTYSIGGTAVSAPSQNSGANDANTQRIVQGAVPIVASTALESCHVLKGSAGQLYSLTASIGATSGYVLVFNLTSAPADGAVTPAWWSPVNSNGTQGGFSADWSAPLSLGTGVTVCFSSATTPFTKTASATAAFSAGVQ